MTNINLFESAQGKNNFKQNNFGGMKTFLVPIIVLVSVFVIFGVAKLYLMYLSGENEKISLEISTEIKNMSGKNVDRVSDFNERMSRAAKEVSLRDDYNGYLSELESLMVSGSRVNSFKYSLSRAEMTLTADNFKTVARQIMSFKGSKYFKDLKVENTSRNKDGKIELGLKK